MKFDILGMSYWIFDNDQGECMPWLYITSKSDRVPFGSPKVLLFSSLRKYYGNREKILTLAPGSPHKSISPLAVSPINIVLIFHPSYLH